MLFEYDYCFCDYRDCPRKDCKRHHDWMPVGVPVSVSYLGGYQTDGECDFYERAPGVAVRLDLNAATEEELVEIGLTKMKAALVVAAREAKGGFRSVADIMKVRSIGKETYQKVCNSLYVEQPPENDSPAFDEQQREWMLRISDATEWISEFLNKTFPRTWCKLRFEHVDAAAYWFTFELVNDDRRQTWCVRHSDLEG